MNKRKIVSFIGRIILIEAALMVLPLLVALYYGDGDAWVFAVTILAALIPGVLMARVRQSDRRLSSRDGYFIVAATWIIISLIGAMRSGAQIISYELSVGLSILTMVVLMGTMQFSEIVEGQADGWFIFKGHIPAVIAFIIYLIAGNAECNRGPFDLPEAESELTAGYHTEYSGMHFGFFYLAEYLNLFIVSAVAATIFLGGWMPLHISGLDGFNAIMDYIPGFIWFFGKAFFVVFLLMWVKWTFPRLRIDQILALEWKYLVPISMLNLLLMVLIVVFGLHF